MVISIDFNCGLANIVFCQQATRKIVLRYEFSSDATCGVEYGYQHSSHCQPQDHLVPTDLWYGYLYLLGA